MYHSSHFFELKMPFLYSRPCDDSFIAPEFILESTEGVEYSLEKCMGKNGLFVMFICNHCPYVQEIIEELVKHCIKLDQDFKIKSVAIMPNDYNKYPADSFEKMKEFAIEHKINFPYLIDRSQSVAKSYGAICTPDLFVFNSKFQLRYRGRLLSEDKKQKDLLNAASTIAQTGDGPKTQFPSGGCSIKWKS